MDLDKVHRRCNLTQNAGAGIMTALSGIVSFSAIPLVVTRACIVIVTNNGVCTIKRVVFQPTPD